MTNISVSTRNYSPPPFNIKEAMRYAGIGGMASDNYKQLILKYLPMVEKYITYRVCFGEFGVRIVDNCIDFGFATVRSDSLGRNLKGCDRVVLFAATVGIGIDRLISLYSSTEPSKSLIIQAIGAERVESLCDVFCQDVAKEMNSKGFIAKPRFSPGYGDLSLDLQKDIVRVLDCSKNIGVCLNNSLLMSPSKSVTAIVGISNQNPA